ncbi:MAG: restriction endonuclease [Candidatus Aenigmatarchaeota archaeon]
MYVIKADGTKEKFQEEKIINTCLRAGVDRDVADEIVEVIKRAVKNLATTHEIYKLILDELEKRKDKSALSFPLREAISNMNPEKFEIYVKKVLEQHGYDCDWNEIVEGECIEHQVDIIAKRDRLFLVECKHHVNHHRFCGLGIVLQVQARFEDIIDNPKASYKFDQAWVITNTKFSDHAKIYASKKNIRLSGWRYQNEHALEEMIQSKKIYPITILKTDDKTKRILMQNNILTIQDVISTKKKIINESMMKKLIEQARLLI